MVPTGRGGITPPTKMIPGASGFPLARAIQSVSDFWGGEVGPKSHEGFNFHMTYGMLFLLTDIVSLPVTLKRYKAGMVRLMH